MATCSKKSLSCIFVAGSLVVCNAWAMTCKQSAQPIAIPDKEWTNLGSSCALSEFGIVYDPELSELSWRYETDNEESFWDGWIGSSDSPVLSSRSDRTFYGVGVWIPKKYQNTDLVDFEDMQDWIKSHGLQMSFGLGGEDDRSARIRFDYRWHDDNLDDISLQIEIPLQ